MQEFKRIVNKKLVLLLLVAFVGNILLYINSQISTTGISKFTNGVKEYNSLIDKYSKNDGYLSDTELAAVIEENDGTIHRIRSGYLEADYNTYQSFQNKVLHLREFPQHMNAIQSNAERLLRFSIFSNDDTFSYYNIIKTSEDFNNVSNVKLRLENDLAAESLTDYYSPFCIALIVFLVIIYTMNIERENAVWDMLYSSKSGRGILAIRRLAVFLAMSFVIVFMLYGSTVIAAYMLYGGSQSLLSPIQQLNDYTLCSLKLNILEFFIGVCVIAWLFLVTLSMIMWTLFTYIRNRNVVLMMICCFAGLEYLFFTLITSQSIYSIFKYVNIFSLINIVAILRKYRNWQIANFICSSLAVIIIIAVIVMLICMLLIIIGMIYQKPHKSMSYIQYKMHGAAEKLIYIKQSFVARLNIYGMELYKLLVTAKGILIVLGVILICTYFCVTSKMNFSEGTKKKDTMYLEMGGKDYTELEKYTENIISEYEYAVNRFEAAKEEKEQGIISADEFIKIGTNYQVAKNNYSFAGEFIEKLEYVKELENNGIQVYAMSERGYEEIFGKYSTRREIILMLAILIGTSLIIFQSMSVEYYTGMDKMIKSAGNGRQYFIIKKIIICFIVAFAMFITGYLIDYAFLCHYYGMPYLQAPVISLMFMRDTAITMPIWQYITLGLIGKAGILVFSLSLVVLASVCIGKYKQKNIEMAVILFIIVLAILYSRISFDMQLKLAGALTILGMALLVVSSKLWSGKVLKIYQL